MVDQVRLTGESAPLVAALNRGTEAWNRFQDAQTRVVKESAKVGKTGTIITRSLQSIDSQGRKVTATFRGTAGAMQLVSTSVKRTTSALEVANKSTKDFNRSLSQIKQAVGFSILFRSVTALQNAITEGTESAIEFSRRIAEIQTIQGKTSLTTEQWTSNLRQLSDSFGIDILTQAEAAYQTLSNQVATGRDAFVFLETANKLALTAVTDTASSVNLLTSAVNAFQLDASQADVVAAQFFKTVELGRVRISELANIFGRIGVPANQLGISLQEVNAAIAAVTIQGVRSEEAITLVRNVILKLIRPTDEMRRIFKELGVASAEAGQAAFGFGGFLSRIEKAAGGTTTGLGKAFGRVRALTGALVLGRQGLAAYGKALEAQNDPNLLSNFETNFKTVFDSNGEVIRRETNRIRNFFQVELGQNVLRAVADFTRTFGGVTPVLEGMSSFIRATAAPALALLAVRLASVASAAAVGRAGLIAFATANPFAALLVGGGVAFSLFQEFGDNAEKSAERIRIANEKLGKSLAEEGQERRKTILKEAAETARILQTGTRAFVSPILEGTIAPLNKAFNDLNKDAKAFNAEVKKAAAETLRAADDAIKKTDNFIKNLGTTVEDSTKAIRDAQSSSAKDIFQLQIDTADPERRIGLLGRRIKVLSDARQAAVASGDNKAFKNAQDQLGKLVAQRNQLIRVQEKGLSPEDRINATITDRRKALEEEIALRQKLIKNVQDQEAAARRVRAEQELLRSDLASALKTFRGESLTTALQGQDEGQIRRALAERESAATRLAALQERLGISQVSNGEIQQSQNRDRLNAENRIAKIRAESIIKERQDIDKQIEARLSAQAEEADKRGKALAAEIQTLSDLRSALGSQVKLEGFSQSDLLGRGNDNTALSLATSGQFSGASSSQGTFTADKFNEALQPTVVQLSELIGILRKEPAQVDAADTKRAEALRISILTTIDKLRTSPGGDTSRAGLQRLIEGRLGQQEGGVAPFPGFSGDLVTQAEIDKDLENVLGVLTALGAGAKTLQDGTSRLIEGRKKLEQSVLDTVETTRRFKEAEEARIKALNLGTTSEAGATSSPETVRDLLQRREALGAPAADPTQATQAAATAAAPQVAAAYKAAVLATAPDVKRIQVDAAIAAERAKATASKVTVDPAADTRNTFEKRKAAAEERAAKRRAANEAAFKKQNDLLAAARARRAAQGPDSAKGILDKLGLGRGSEGALKDLRGARPEALQTEADALKELTEAIQSDLNNRFGPGDDRSTPQRIPGPLESRGATALVPGVLGLQIPTAPATEIGEDGIERFSTRLDTAQSRLDLLNETINTVQNTLINSAIQRDGPARIGQSDQFIQRAGAVGDLGERSFELDDGQNLRDSAQSLKTAAERLTEFGGNLKSISAPIPDPSRISNNGIQGPGNIRVRAFSPDRIRGSTPKAGDGGSDGGTNVNFGGFTINESGNPQQTAKTLQQVINRSLRSGQIKIGRNRG